MELVPTLSLQSTTLSYRFEVRGLCKSCKELAAKSAEDVWDRKLVSLYEQVLRFA